MKVRLEKKAFAPAASPCLELHKRVKPVSLCLPFFKVRYHAKQTLIHRVRFAFHHWIDGKYSHTSYSFWCGNVNTSSKGYLLSDGGQSDPFCATCEGRAVRAGLDGVRMINGRLVLYSPKK